MTRLLLWFEDLFRVKRKTKFLVYAANKNSMTDAQTVLDQLRRGETVIIVPCGVTVQSIL